MVALSQEEELDNKERNKRVMELLTRKDEITEELATLDTKMGELSDERHQVDSELQELIGIVPQPSLPLSNGRKCALCGVEGHIIARTKTADGKPTCKTYPNGKPQEA
jgi:DNA repair exonuclease SbcCD ATPase subunit